MKIDRKSLLLYLVTDRSWSDEDQFINQIEDSLIHGVSFLQLREKNIDSELFLKRAIEMKNLAKKYEIPFVINDDVQVALDCDADGVHIGQDDMSVIETRKMIGKDKILGVSVGNLEEALKAELDGADYLGVGAMYNTSTKKDARDVSINILKEICDKVEIPVVAIGGISAENILELKKSNVDGVALISAILAQENIGKATQNLKNLSEEMTKKEIKKVLTIAGSDCSGGAGIQADLKTMAAHGCYGMSVITALTAQNTTGVYGVENCSTEFIENQIDCVFNDISPDAVKIGMVSSASIVKSISEKLKLYKPKYIVVDPVMVSTSGSKLLDEDAMESLIKELIPLATVITPNLFEAELLCGFEIRTSEEMIKAAEKISKKYRGNILIKGGHLENNANDLLYKDGKAIWFEGERVDNSNTHGTGCTLSSAIASNLAKGYSVEESIRNSKAYITGALNDKLDLGKGSGPLNHCYQWINK